MMKAIYLEPGRTGAKSTPKFALPKCDPRLDREINIGWRTKEMNVIRHDRISTDHPSIGLFPRVQQRAVYDCVCKVLLATAGTDRDENNRRLPQKNEHTLSWMPPLLELRALPRLDSVSPYQIRTPRRLHPGRARLCRAIGGNGGISRPSAENALLLPGGDY